MAFWCWVPPYYRAWAAGRVVRLRVATAFLAVFMVACDQGYEATVRNDLEQDVILKFAFDSGQLIDEGAGPLHPGRFASVGKVGGPGERPRLLLKAFDLQGNLGVLPTAGLRRLPQHLTDSSDQHPTGTTHL